VAKVGGQAYVVTGSEKFFEPKGKFLGKFQISRAYKKHFGRVPLTLTSLFPSLCRSNTVWPFETHLMLVVVIKGTLQILQSRY